MEWTQTGFEMKPTLVAFEMAPACFKDFLPKIIIIKNKTKQNPQNNKQTRKY